MHLNVALLFIQLLIEKLPYLFESLSKTMVFLLFLQKNLLKGLYFINFNIAANLKQCFA